MDTRERDGLDQADMVRLRSGHDAALDSLMERNAPLLFGFLCRFVGDEEAANDLAQEAFVRVYLHRSDFKAGQRFSTWLFTIAGNLARNHLRSRSRRPESPLEGETLDGSPGLIETLASTALSPDQNALKVEQQAAVQEAVAQLPDDLREAIVLCELEERSLSEAAGLLNTSVKAIESRLYRARKRLRHGLSQWLSLG